MKHYETSCFTSRCFMLFHPVRSMDPWIRPPHDPCLRPCTNGNRLHGYRALANSKRSDAASEIRTKKSAKRLLHLSLETPHRHPHPATTRAHSDVLTQQAPKKALHLEPLVQPTRRTEHEWYPGIIRYPHPSCVSTRDRFALESRNTMNYLNLWMGQFHEEKNTQIERGIPLAPFGQGAEATILRQSNSSATNVLLNFVLQFASCFLGFYQFCKRESDRFEHHLPFYRRSKVLKSIGNFRPWYSSQKPIGTLAVLPSRSL